LTGVIFIILRLHFIDIGDDMYVSKLLDKLDSILERYDKLVIDAENLGVIIDKIIAELKECPLYKRGVESGVIDLYFTCYNESCVHIQISFKPLNINNDLLRLSWKYIGDSCHEWVG